MYTDLMVYFPFQYQQAQLFGPGTEDRPHHLLIMKDPCTPWYVTAQTSLLPNQVSPFSVTLRFSFSLIIT